MVHAVPLVANVADQLLVSATPAGTVHRTVQPRATDPVLVTVTFAVKPCAHALWIEYATEQAPTGGGDDGGGEEGGGDDGGGDDGGGDDGGGDVLPPPTGGIRYGPTIAIFAWFTVT